jgi:hypothetical protein
MVLWQRLGSVTSSIAAASRPLSSLDQRGLVELRSAADM